jgi:hypothetical protein
MANAGNEESGVGGWLALLVFGLMIGGPLISLGTTLSGFEDAERQSPQLLSMTSWQNAKVVTWGVTFLQIGLSFSAGWRLTNSFIARSVTYAKIVLWLAGPVLYILGILLLSGMIKLSLGGFVTGLIRSAMYALIWTLYLKKSRRVQNTYYGNRAAALEDEDATSADRPSYLRPVKARPWNFSLGQRKAIFCAGTWVILVLAFALLFDAPYDGFFGGWGGRDWDKILTWTFVPPLLSLFGLWSYRRFVIASG